MSDDFDLIHRAFSAGYASGFARGQMAASEDLARQWLAELSSQQAEQAYAGALERHGPEWARAMVEQAQP